MSEPPQGGSVEIPSTNVDPFQPTAGDNGFAEYQKTHQTFTQSENYVDPRGPPVVGTGNETGTWEEGKFKLESWNSTGFHVDPKIAPKRIIICCDGTWQSAVSGKANSPSNVTRLARCLNRAARDKDEKEWQQVVWYDSGVGTTSSWLGTKTEGAFGWGLEGNVIEAYNFVVLNYNIGDQIMCFGFSRGAYTARAIAGLISDIGVCQPHNLHNFHEIWEAYKKTKSGDRFYGSDAYFDWLDGVPMDDTEARSDPYADSDDEKPWMEKSPEAVQRAFSGGGGDGVRWKHPPHDRDWTIYPESRTIEVVGVYDTVGALGMPTIQGKQIWHPGPAFHNVRLNRNIKRAFQALALDEHREAFSPTLYYLPDNVQKPTEEDIQKQTKVVEKALGDYVNVFIFKPRQETKEAKLKIRAAYNEARRKLIRMEEHAKPESELLQVWFPGVHINCGGGSSDTLEDKGDLEEISNISFTWMLEQIRPYLSLDMRTLSYEEVDRQKHIAEYNEMFRRYKKNADKKEAEAKKSWTKWAALRRDQFLTTAKGYVPLIKHEHPPDKRRNDVGWGTGAIIESYTRMYAANGSAPRTPGAYANAKKEDHRTYGRTNEQIHPTVGYRIHMTKDLGDPELVYKPLNEKEGEPRKVVRQKCENGRGWEYVINGVKLPEYVVKPDEQNLGPNGWPIGQPAGWPSFERNVMSGQAALEYIKQLDADNGYSDENKYILVKKQIVWTPKVQADYTAAF